MIPILIASLILFAVCGVISLNDKEKTPTKDTTTEVSGIEIIKE